MTKKNNITKDSEPMQYDALLGNVIIAKFMGLTPIKGVSEHNGKDYYYYNNAEMQDFEALPTYDSEWGDVMPVVEKINKRDWVTIYNDECKIHALVVGEFEDIDIINEGEPLIKSIYEAVLKYAEWHSDNVA